MKVKGTVVDLSLTVMTIIPKQTNKQKTVMKVPE